MPPLLGSTLGPYQILEQIGLGGMATVYKAYQPGMNRLVALKVLPEHYARDPRFVKRFEREAQVVAKLEHRNIIPIYDYGSHNDITYLAMRYLQAGTVKDILAHGALPLNDVAKLLSDISSALDYAHSQGIIHRDVKPSNVLVDKQGNAYLTDFGIAKVLEGTADFTGSSVLGTPTYMAPEQTLGKPATAQSDIYSLGVMLYEMVVGKPPFEADTPMAIALMHVHEPLPLPRKIKDDIPEAVELIILKALAKDPKDRFQTANELARALTSAIGAESLATPSRLIELASGAAEGKGSEEVTYDIREEVKRKERTEKRKKLMRFVPVGAVIVVIIGLVSALIWFSLLMQESQTASQRTATAVVFFAQTATESVYRLMATPSFNTAVAQIQEATRTQAAIETVMQSYRLTYAKGTQSVEETIIALTPTKTPTMTRTFTPTSTITITYTPTRTSTPVTPTGPVTYINMIMQSLGGCEPKTAPAGLIIFNAGVGRWATKEKAAEFIAQEPYPTITVNNQPTENLWRSDVQWHTGNTPDGWGYNARTQIVLSPGDYYVVDIWGQRIGHETRSCTLKIIAP